MLHALNLNAMVKPVRDRPVVLAAVAHPDDIEFNFAGTLLLLKESGCEVHMWNLSDGCLGSMVHSASETSEIRSREAALSACLAGAIYHRPLFSDLDIFYDRSSLSKVAAVIREIGPQIILTHSPRDYMEDHQNVCRLIVSGAFARSMPNYVTDPPRLPRPWPLRIYHAPPHGLHDGLGHRFEPEFLINIASVLALKERMLMAHRSQQQWLESTQGMTFVEEMKELAHLQARQSDELEHAEGWRRHSPLGFCEPGFDPLVARLGSFVKTISSKAQ